MGSKEITMSMMANGQSTGLDMEKECSKRHQLEELKEEFMNMVNSLKSLKSFRRVNEHHIT